MLFWGVIFPNVLVLRVQSAHCVGEGRRLVGEEAAPSGRSGEPASPAPDDGKFTPQPPPTTRSSRRETYTPRYPGAEIFVIAGRTFHQAVLRTVCEDDPVVVEADDNNPHDRNAVKVLTVSDRRLIGHIKKNETAKARRLMCGGQANGAIVSVFEHWQNAEVGVKLHSVWREALGIRISTRERKSSRQRRCRKGRWVDVSLVLVLLHMHGTFFQMPFYTQCPIGHKKKKEAMMADVQAQGAGNCWGSPGAS